MSNDKNKKTTVKELRLSASRPLRIGRAMRPNLRAVDRMMPQRVRPGIAPSRLPGAPMTNPFNNLPFPSPGDRIKAEDFRSLSQGLSMINDVFVLSSALFGQPFGTAKLALASQQYRIHKVMSVFGHVLEDPENESLDNRKVIQVVPTELGERAVCVILTEAVETRRLTPNLRGPGKTFGDALSTMRSVLGDVTFPVASVSTPDLRDRLLEEAKEDLVRRQ